MLDLNFNPDGTPRSNQDLLRLLDSVKRNDANLSRDKQDKLIDEINYKLTGRRYTDKEVMQDILDGQADLDDII